MCCFHGHLFVSANRTGSNSVTEKKLKVTPDEAAMKVVEVKSVRLFLLLFYILCRSD